MGGWRKKQKRVSEINHKGVLDNRKKSILRIHILRPAFILNC